MSCTCFLGHAPCSYCTHRATCEGCGEPFSRVKEEDTLCDDCSAKLEKFKTQLQASLLAALRQAPERIPFTDAGYKKFVDSAVEIWNKLYPPPQYEIELLPVSIDDRKTRTVRMLIKDKSVTQTITFNVEK